jgi:hypothetical protein
VSIVALACEKVCGCMCIELCGDNAGHALKQIV